MTAKSQIPKKHHFIPQFWTKNWASSDGLVQRFTRPHPSKVASLRKHPAAIGWHNRLYELPSAADKSVNFETIFFRKLDQAASDLFKKLLAEPEPHLGAFESEALAIFIISLLHRSPSAIEAMEKLSSIMEAEIRSELRPRYHEVRGKDDPQTVEEFEQQLGPDPHLRHLSGVFREVTASNRLASVFVRLNWRRIQFTDAENNLLLSDDPLIRTNGILQPNGHLAFPPSPKIAIFGLNRPEHFKELIDQPLSNIVTQMNTQAVESARHFVVDRDERQHRFISNRFGQNPRPTLSEASLKTKMAHGAVS
ncbi:MAG: DUF4238 domain-containing protein [Pseudomonadota bacterium]